ncbi:MAG: 7-cyano-7-deazaguanine synthase [Oligoflexales bacterium]|nr:7-cyano-7-deazaguanine synthase [Oligoflexales bacterium]
MNRKPILLYGGGLDSTAYLILMHNDGIDFKCLWIDYGQKGALNEKRAARYFTQTYGIELIEAKNEQIARYALSDCQLLSGNTDHPSYVNGRNFSLILQALEYGDEVFLGLVELEYQSPPDADIEFLKRANAILKGAFHRDVRILAPYIACPRVELLTNAYEINQELFQYASSCWIGGDQAMDCGHCKKCLIRQKQWEIVKKRYDTRMNRNLPKVS